MYLRFVVLAIASFVYDLSSICLSKEIIKYICLSRINFDKSKVPIFLRSPEEFKLMKDKPWQNVIKVAFFQYCPNLAKVLLSKSFGSKCAITLLKTKLSSSSSETFSDASNIVQAGEER